MKSAPILAGLLLANVPFLQAIYGQSSVMTTSGSDTVAIAEPASMSLTQLFSLSDMVAVVRIVAGDTENYKTALYKATVVKSYKGTTDGQVLYFGPYEGYGLGSEYVVFLKTAKDLAAPKSAPGAAWGTVKYSQVFNQGYSAMETSYQCVFEGKTVQDNCDHGVRVCTDYIRLPKQTLVFPHMDISTPFGCRWVRESRFLSLLDRFAELPGVLRMP